MNLRSDPQLEEKLFSGSLKPRVRHRCPWPLACTRKAMQRLAKQRGTPRVGRGVAGDALVAYTVVERHVVVVVAEVDLPVAGYPHGDGVVLILRPLDVVREPKYLPLRRRGAAVKTPPAEGDVLGVVCAG